MTDNEVIMENFNNVNHIIDDLKEEMLNDLSDLIKIPSVGDEPIGSCPFGSEVQKVFESFLEIGKRDGFDICNVDNYGGHIEFKGESEDIFALLCHVDVVPAGSGWDQDPFTATVKDGKLYGRGAIDDKGPTVAAYYAMKALKRAGFKPKKNIRLIIGLDEETNWDGIKYYLKKEKTPCMGFAPDADFPVIHCEKGLIVFDLIKKIEKAENLNEHRVKLVSLKGGNAPNMVADRVLASIENADLTNIVNSYVERTGHTVQCEKTKTGCVIKVAGVSAHGAMPEKGVNAITVFCELVKDVEFSNDRINDFIKFYNEKIGFNFHGENCGIDFEDAPSGKLNFNVGMLSIDEDNIKLTINIRYPATMTEDDIYAGMEKTVTGYEVVKIDHLAPLYVAKDHELVKVLMEVYREFTGDNETEPLVIGGATYARTIPNCVAFGPVFPGEASVEHQPNEFICIESMIKSTKMYAEAIYRLCK